jgi:hypothetical protein
MPSGRKQKKPACAGFFIGGLSARAYSFGKFGYHLNNARDVAVGNLALVNTLGQCGSCPL